MSNDRPHACATRKEISEFLRLGLRLGAFDTAPIIKWADSIIEQEDTPEISIIDVSLAGGRGVNETITCLGEIKGNVRENIPVELVLAYYRRKLVSRQLTTDEVAAMLYTLSKITEVKGDLSGALNVLDENLSMAEDGVCGSVEEALDDLKNFLEEHCEYEHCLPQEV